MQPHACYRPRRTVPSFRGSLYAGALFALIVVSGCVIAVDDDDFDFDNDVVARETFSYTVDLDNQSRLRLEGINGNVEIVGDRGAFTITVEGEKKVGSNTIRDAERRLDDLDVDIDERSSEIVVRTRQPTRTEGRNYVVDYTITLPTDLAAYIDLVNGNITIETLENDVSINNTNGNARLRDIVGSVTVDQTNGNIDCEAVLPFDGTIDLSTTNGNIDLAIPHSTSADFSARVTNGSINASDLDLSDITQTNRSLSGTLGSGDGTIELRTTNGNIRVEDF